MKILALEHELPGATAVQFHFFAKAEALMVWNLTQAGLMRVVYFPADPLSQQTKC